MANHIKNPLGMADTKNHQTVVALVKVLTGPSVADALDDLTPANDNEGGQTDADA